MKLTIPASEVRPGDVLLDDDGQPFRKDWRSEVKMVEVKVEFTFRDYRDVSYPADHLLDVEREES